MITSPICFSCRWLNDKPNENDDLTCRAFPRGIPQEILDGYDHTRPYPGDSGVVFESLETVSANQKSLEGMSNRLDDSGDPLDLLEGSERVRKYNPNHDRLGRFATGSAGGAFTEEDKAAVSTYLKPQKAAWSEEVNHRAINDQLRGMAEHDRPDVSDAITKLDAAFAHGDTIPAGTELYRGIPGVRLSEVYKVGDTFTDYGFSSHSKNEGEAFDFITGRAQMGTANSRATGTLLKVKVTQPTTAIDVAQHFDDPLYKREQEVLLNRGTKFRVTEIYTGPMADIEDVIVEVVR